MSHQTDEYGTRPFRWVRAQGLRPDARRLQKCRGHRWHFSKNRHLRCGAINLAPLRRSRAWGYSSMRLKESRLRYMNTDFPSNHVWLLYNLVMLIITIIQKHIQYRRTLSFQIRTGLLTSGFGPWRHKETQFLKVYANHTMMTPPQRAAHLVMFKISIHLFRM